MCICVISLRLIYGGRKKAVEFGDMKEMERLKKEEEKGQVLNKMDEESVRKTKIERVTESKRQRESSEEMWR